jgi:hypothetical protein
MKQPSLVCLLLLAVSCSGADAPPPKSNLTVVPHAQLLELLPALPGWTRGEPQGTTDPAEAVSRVQVDYDQVGGIGGLSVEIMDTTMNANILGPLQEFIKANRTETLGDAATPLTATPTQVSGFPARQEWTAIANNGSLGILVAGRFTVAVTGNSIAGPAVMRQAAEAIDLKKLASLK